MRDKFADLIKSGSYNKSTTEKSAHEGSGHDRATIIQLWQAIFREYPGLQPKKGKSIATPSRRKSIALVADEHGPIGLERLDEWRKGYANRIQTFVAFVKKSQFKEFLPFFPFFNVNEALCFELLVAPARKRLELLRMLPIEAGEFVDWHLIFKYTFTPAFGNWLECQRWLAAETWSERCEAYKRCCWEADRCATDPTFKDSGFRHCDYMFELLENDPTRPATFKLVRFKRSNPNTPRAKMLTDATVAAYESKEKASKTPIESLKDEFRALGVSLKPIERRLVFRWIDKGCPLGSAPRVSDSSFEQLVAALRIEVSVDGSDQESVDLDDKEVLRWIELFEEKRTRSWRDLSSKFDVSERTVRRKAALLGYDLKHHTFPNPSAQVRHLLEKPKMTKKN